MTGIVSSAPPRLAGDPLDSAGAWRRSLVALGLVLAALVFSYPETIARTYTVWMNSETHRFSLLVIPMALFLIWERRDRLRYLIPTPHLPALLFAVPCGGLWLIAETMHVALAAQIGVLGLLQSALLGVLGWRVYRALLFPFLFLWLLVPIGDSLTPLLIDLTTRLTAAGVALFGLDVSTDGNIVISEAGRIGIVAECSALDFLIGNLVLSLFFANIVYSRAFKRIAYVLIGLTIAILANNVRTTSVILITHWTDGQWDLLSDHLLYGWLIFFAFAAIQMTVGALFRDPRAALDPAAMITPAGPVRHTPARRMITTLALIVSVVLPPQVIALRATRVAPPPDLALDAPGWLVPHTVNADGWQPIFEGAQATLLAGQQFDDRPVELFVGYYWQQDEDAEMIGWPNAVHDGEVWHFLDQQRHIAAYDGQPIGVTETRLRGPEKSRRLTWRWYWVDGRFVRSPLAAKLLHAKASVLGGDTRSAVIVVSSVMRRDREIARQSMQALLDRATFLIPMLDAAGIAPQP